jgi:hypothetical protein
MTKYIASGQEPRMAVTTLRQMRPQMPHTEIDDFFYTQILFKK